MCEEKETFTLDKIVKLPDNPLFSEEKKKHQDYIDGLQQQVEMLKAKDPMKYMKYQAIGNSLMNCTYDPNIGDDDEGDIIKARELMNLFRDYDITDFSKKEIELLRKVYGEKWNC